MPAHRTLGQILGPRAASDLERIVRTIPAPSTRRYHMTDSKPQPDDLRPARAILITALVTTLLAAIIIVTLRYAPLIDGDPDPAPTAHELNLAALAQAMNACPDASERPQHLVLQMLVDAHGVVHDVICTELRRPSWLPQRRRM